jgi:Arc/MetJ-type ribon-helix-helix transcriptional regulator
MAQGQHFVVLHQNAWKVVHEGKHCGAFGSREEAIRAAVDAAQKSAAEGHDAQVVAQRANDKFRLEWTSGHGRQPQHRNVIRRVLAALAVPLFGS